MTRQKGRGGRLTPEDEALWRNVTQSVTPLKPERRVAGRDGGNEDAEPAVLKPPPKAAKPASTPQHPPPTTPKHPVSPRPPAQPAALDRRTKQRIARGTIAIDGRIDLHGMTQREAHGRLKGFLTASQLRGHRHVLVITGKGGWTGPHHDGHDFAERGVLRRVVPQWLGLPEFGALVASFEQAHIGHGGAGAFYVRLRKRPTRHPR